MSRENSRVKIFTTLGGIGGDGGSQLEKEMRLWLEKVGEIEIKAMTQVVLGNSIVTTIVYV